MPADRKLAALQSSRDQLQAELADVEQAISTLESAATDGPQPLTVDEALEMLAAQHGVAVDQLGAGAAAALGPIVDAANARAVEVVVAGLKAAGHDSEDIIATARGEPRPESMPLANAEAQPISS